MSAVAIEAALRAFVIRVLRRELIVAARAVFRREWRILVRVVDRGPGIPKAQQERIFEPFYRSGTKQTGHRGSGLGLAIVRGFVEANGGRVWVE